MIIIPQISATKIPDYMIQYVTGFTQNNPARTEVKLMA